jgi:hypothetical protein
MHWSSAIFVVYVVRTCVVQAQSIGLPWILYNVRHRKPRATVYYMRHIRELHPASGVLRSETDCRLRRIGAAAINMYIYIRAHTYFITRRRARAAASDANLLNV